MTGPGPLLLSEDHPRVTLVVFVAGRPAPQGSKHARPIYRGKGNAREFTGKVAQVDSSGDALKTWRDDVRGELRDDHGQPKARFGDAAVVVRLEFRMARPKSHYRTGRNAHLLRDSAPRYPAGKPDIDKTSRAVLDAITSAGVWADDSQAVDLHASKRWAELNETEGCHIRLESADVDSARLVPQLPRVAPGVVGEMPRHPAGPQRRSERLS